MADPFRFGLTFGIPLQWRPPFLGFSLLPETDISLHRFLSGPSMACLFFLPLSLEAEDELSQIVQTINGLPLNPDHSLRDSWSFIWVLRTSLQKNFINIILTIPTLTLFTVNFGSLHAATKSKFSSGFS
ncbi:hypothetical protein GUJ93_ZPchr0013g34662 [Zizania palustris]|uniref:Uncharacterized protein n=1 Tax=Zizania palustris TaxID=103762 RepID=A0A8J5X0D0_ZIZPA|nr:hypothetical protein GUJ93_ZPchr0013g34662 [Zizania palustris]